MTKEQKIDSLNTKTLEFDVRQAPYAHSLFGFGEKAGRDGKDFCGAAIGRRFGAGAPGILVIHTEGRQGRFGHPWAPI